MKALIQALLQYKRERAFAAYERACKTPERAQEEVLRWLLARSGHTAFARRVGATPHRIRSVDDLRAKVPLSAYDDLAPEIEASVRGEPDQLIPGRPDFFALTSGTTGRSKYVPIDDAYRKAFQTPMQHYLYGIVRDHPRAFAKKVLYMVGAPELERTPGGAIAGTISGYNYRALPRLLSRFGAVPWEVFAIRDPRAQLQATVRLALRHEVSFAVAITTSSLAALGEAMRDHAESLLRDLHDGTLTISEGELTPAERASLAPHLGAHRSRARALSRAAERHGALVPKVAWPELAVLSCWAHAGAASHLHLFPSLYGELPIRSAVYAATEGWINVPMRDDDPAGPLAIESGLYEFEELDERGEPTGRTRLPHEVEVGGEYGIVLSSGCGIFRYRLGDRVRVSRFFHRTPEVAFVQKIGSVLSLAHDMTSEHHVDTAIASLAGEAPLSRWVFGPGEGLPPRYRLAVTHSEGLDTDALAARFDVALRRANWGYDTHRTRGDLAPVEVVAISPAAFAAWDAARRREVGHQAKAARFLMRASDFPEGARVRASA